jgi:hypothetical protein
VSDYEHLAQHKIVAAKAQPMPRSQNEPVAEPKPWSSVRMIYQIDKTAGTLTVALLVKRSHDGETFSILLGARSDFDVGIHICDESSDYENDKSADLQHAYNPYWYTPGTWIELSLHAVCVSIEEQVDMNRKMYFVDIDVKAFPPAPTTTEIVHDAISSFAGPGRPAARNALRDKVRRLRW